MSISSYVFGGFDAGLVEGVGAVPDGRLVGGLEVQAVERAVDAAVVLPHARVVGVRRTSAVVLESGLSQPFFGELLEHADLRDHHHVGGVAALDLAADDGGDVVAGGDELGLGAGLLGEGVQHLLEVLLLAAGPDTGHGDRLAAERLVAAARGDGAAAAGGRAEGQGEGGAAREQGGASSHHR